MARKKNWIQQAIKKPGAFTEWCRRQGFSGVTRECIEKGKRSSNPTTRRRAVLAETLRKLSRSVRRVNLAFSFVWVYNISYAIHEETAEPVDAFCKSSSRRKREG